ncbi:zinc finger protein ZIC 5-like [Erinaceus europaeus]|uniref:Zinc finger protein ZIC 5-like n=1 Tax=Erinaceus europaeus TaxID=9365 RepID=A0ABM3WTE0_ERIEU|nr:zinc finger protein ZIC 5-like [Erinaceus europaeus]
MELAPSWRGGTAGAAALGAGAGGDLTPGSCRARRGPEWRARRDGAVSLRAAPPRCWQPLPKRSPAAHAKRWRAGTGPGAETERAPFPRSGLETTGSSPPPMQPNFSPRAAPPFPGPARLAASRAVRLESTDLIGRFSGRAAVPKEGAPGWGRRAAKVAGRRGLESQEGSRETETARPGNGP